MKRKLQVFISSTFTDLIEERQAAVSAILKSGHIPAGMELFTAGDRSQMETINQWIDESDIYMLILGGRYGSMETSTNLSYTELEFDYAAFQNKPMFAVVINENALEKKVKDKGTSFIEKDNPKELKIFREKVLSKVSSFFDDTKDIKLCVYESLSDYASRPELKGWVSGSEITDTKPLIDEIKKISEENLELKEKIKTLEKTTAPPKKATNIETEQIIELKELLKSIQISVPAKLSSDGKEHVNNLLDIFYNTRSTIILGVTNSSREATDRSRFLYFNICPKLQIHGVTENEEVTGTKLRRFFVTPFGMKLLANIEKERSAQKSIKKISTDTRQKQ